MSTVTVDRDPRVLAVIESLTAADDSQFRVEVDLDLRREGSKGDVTVRARWEARRQALRSPELVDRWFTHLSMISKSVEGQLASMQEDHEADKAGLRQQMMGCPSWTGSTPCCAKHGLAWEKCKGDYAKARAGKLRFKTGLDEWVIEARGLRDAARNSMYDSVVTDERNHYAGKAQRLEAAITAHRDTLLEDDVEPSPEDERLWAVLVT